MEPAVSKQAIRKEIASLKRAYSQEALQELSEKLLERLEATSHFQQAACVALYNAIPGEVQTACFLQKWYQKKRLLLPLVVGDDLHLLPYAGEEGLRPGAFGIMEPIDQGITVAEEEIDLIIVPGVAFDRQLNRLGRGKGFYDRLLTTVQAPKVGICFDFQLIDNVPVEPFDRKMDIIITEKELISEIRYRE